MHGTTTAEMIAEARARRRRLMNPPNAVIDLGIDLKRKPGPIVSRETPEPEQIEPEVKKSEFYSAPFLKYISCARIIYYVALHYNLPMMVLLSKRRTANVVIARHVAAYLIHTMLNKSLPEIGRKLRRDHTSVLFAVRKITRMRKTDQLFRSEITALEAEIRASIT